MRRPEGFNIAFLDIMACGLGAVVLILVLLRNQGGLTDSLNNQTLDISGSLQKEISLLSDEVSEIQEKIDQSNQNQSEIIDQISPLTLQLADLKDETRSKMQKLRNLQKVTEDINHKTQLLDIRNEPAPLNATDNKLEKFLFGFKVTGERIAVLIDSSSSMAAERLIDITLLKVKTDTDRKKAEKWRATVRAVYWILANLPPEANFRLFKFSEGISELTSRWTKAADQKTMSDLVVHIDSIDPVGGTNLQVAISKVLSTQPDSIYIVTDGLPTMSNRSFLKQSVSDCPAIIGRSRVSGPCREAMFTDVEALTNGYKGTVSVILLPLEGDPMAAPLFSRWTLRHDGTLFSPARGWP